jgi:hypothetical protein
MVIWRQKREQSPRRGDKKESGAGTMVSRSGALGTGSPKRVAGSRVSHSQGIVWFVEEGYVEEVMERCIAVPLQSGRSFMVGRR